MTVLRTTAHAEGLEARHNPQPIGDELISIVLSKDFSFSTYFDSMVILFLIIFTVAVIIYKVMGGYLNVGIWKSFEIDQAQFGLGKQKLTLRPNQTDRQIAYKIWVELSTRKIGLPIDLDNDVISEIYNSWYDFFSVTRELIKDVPVSKFQRKDTEKIIKLSIDVLNEGIRPHLTKWQARFRRWYERAINQEDYLEIPPQDIQKKFPQYDELRTDLKEVNERLIRYKEKMYELVTNL